MKIATPMAFLAATLLVGSLAACSSDSKEADASPSAPVVGTSSTPMESSAAPSASRSEDATAEDTPAPAAPADLGELTAPGAELSTDQPLNVSLRSTLYDKEADAVDYGDVAAVYTFDGIRKGSAENLSGVFGDDDIAKLSEYDIAYVDYTVTLPGGAPTDPAMGVAGVTELDAYDTTGARVSGGFVFFDGGPEICAYASQNELVDSGSTKACQIVAITKGESLDKLEFAGDDSGDADNPYEEAPAVWTIS
jgi:hypothetical protein